MAETTKLLKDRARPPGASDDVESGYYPGNQWRNTATSPPDIYVCQANPAGAAQWKLIGGASQNASEVPFSPSGNVAATDVQTAIEEVDSEKATASVLTAHTGDTANPHSTDIANLAPGTLAELNANVSDATLDDSGDARPPTGHTHTEADITDLSHDAVSLQGRTVAATAPTDGQALAWNDTAGEWEPQSSPGTDDQTAAEVQFSPAGNIAATDVQAAVEELDTEKAATGHSHTQGDVSFSEGTANITADQPTLTLAEDLTRITSDGDYTIHGIDGPSVVTLLNRNAPGGGVLTIPHLSGSAGAAGDRVRTPRGQPLQIPPGVAITVEEHQADTRWDVLEGAPIADRVIESSGPTVLSVGAIADGEYARRSGTQLVGDTPSGGGSFDVDAVLTRRDGTTMVSRGGDLYVRRT